MLVYVDTDVFLNYILNRKNKQGKSLGEEAELFFSKVISTDLEILISRKVLEELYGQIEPNEVQMLFEFLKSKIRVVPYDKQDLLEAEQLDAENRNDALHAILARKHGADCLVTRNMKHFKKYSLIIKVKYQRL